MHYIHIWARIVGSTVLITRREIMLQQCYIIFCKQLLYITLVNYKSLIFHLYSLQLRENIDSISLKPERQSLVAACSTTPLRSLSYCIIKILSGPRRSPASSSLVDSPSRSLVSRGSSMCDKLYYSHSQAIILLTLYASSLSDGPINNSYAYKWQ